MARILVTEQIADGGLDRLRAAGHDVDVQLGAVARGAARDRQGRPRPHHPVGHHGHRRGARRRHRPRRGRPGRHRARQRRRRGRHRAGRDGRQRAAVEHPVGRRAHHGAAAGPGPQHPPGPRRARRTVGGSARSGTASSCPTRRSASSASAASASSSPSGPSAFGMRLVAFDPFVSRRAGPPARASSSWTSTSCWPQSDFVTHPRGQDARDHRPDQRRAAGQGQAGHPHHQRRPRRHRRRGRARRRHPRRATSAAPRSTCSPRSRPPSRRCSRSTRVVVTPHLGRQHRRGAGQGGRHHRRAGRPGPRRRLRALRRQRERRPRRPRRCGRSCRWPSASASCSRRSAPRRSTPLEIEYQGQLADYDTRILTLSLLKGFFGRISDEPVSYVNAPQLAEERGIAVRESKTTTAHDYVNLITVRGGEHALAGTLVGPAGRAPHRDGRRPHRRRAAGRAHARSCATTTGPA